MEKTKYLVSAAYTTATGTEKRVVVALYLDEPNMSDKQLLPMVRRAIEDVTGRRVVLASLIDCERMIA